MHVISRCLFRLFLNLPLSGFFSEKFGLNFSICYIQKVLLVNLFIFTSSPTDFFVFVEYYFDDNVKLQLKRCDR